MYVAKCIYFLKTQYGKKNIIYASKLGFFLGAMCAVPCKYCCVQITKRIKDLSSFFETKNIVFATRVSKQIKSQKSHSTRGVVKLCNDISIDNYDTLTIVKILRLKFSSHIQR